MSKGIIATIYAIMAAILASVQKIFDFEICLFFTNRHLSKFVFVRLQFFQKKTALP